MNDALTIARVCHEVHRKVFLDSGKFPWEDTLEELRQPLIEAVQRRMDTDAPILDGAPAEARLFFAIVDAMKPAEPFTVSALHMPR